MPTYNEAKNLRQIVPLVLDKDPCIELLVVDDNSPDGTGDWCDGKAAEDSRLHCLHRPAKLGLGTATVAGMRYAIEHDYTFLVTLDADFSHHPRYLPDLLDGMEQDG